MAFGTGVCIAPKQMAFDLDHAFGNNRLDADIELASFAQRIDAGLDETEILVKHGVLQGDREGQQAVEPTLDRRQVILQAAAVLVR